jgi:hypothetical protein
MSFIKNLHLIKVITILLSSILLFPNNFIFIIFIYYSIGDSIINNIEGHSIFYVNKDESYIDEIKVYLFENYTLTYEILLKCLVLMAILLKIL